jgi:hypothetical protein
MLKLCTKVSQVLAVSRVLAVSLLLIGIFSFGFGNYQLVSVITNTETDHFGSASVLAKTVLNQTDQIPTC